MWAAAVAVVVAAAAARCSVAAPAAPTTRWKQDVFAITNWVAPNPDGSDAFPGAFDTEADKRYAEYVAANFTAMLGSLTDVHPPAGVRRPWGNWSQTLEEQVVLAEKYGLKIIPSLPVSPGISIASGNATLVDVSDRVASSKAFWGFDFYDEPTTKLFPALAKLAKQVGERYPGKLRFINLLPNYAASGTQLFAKNYTDYVDRFVTEMNADGAGPDIIICMVRSPVRRPLLCTAIALNCTAPHRTALRLGSILCHIAIESWPDDHRTTTRSSRTSTVERHHLCGRLSRNPRSAAGCLVARERAMRCRFFRIPPTQRACCARTTITSKLTTVSMSRVQVLEFLQCNAVRGAL